VVSRRLIGLAGIRPALSGRLIGLAGIRPAVTGRLMELGPQVGDDVGQVSRELRLRVEARQVGFFLH